MHIFCIGAGPVGCSWAASFLAAGHDVSLWDDDDTARAAAVQRIEIALGLVAPPARGRLNLLRRPEPVLASVDHVQESISEILADKQRLFAMLDTGLAPHATLGSSTSAIPGSAFLCGLRLSPRAMVVHPTNPPHIIPLVELCRTPETADAAVSSVRALLATTGHETVDVRREIGGYLLNRMQAALVAEALHLVQAGVATPADIDTVVATGLAPRWAMGGPFLTGHLNADGGYLDYMTRYASVWRGLVEGLHGKADWSEETLIAIDRDVRERFGGAPSEHVLAARDHALMALYGALRMARATLSPNAASEDAAVATPTA
ncbi:MAG: 3-hydroxyacyl-CoA dehydrogenase NAD-binding domain-containing protein [Thermaurantiacus sp.]